MNYSLITSIPKNNKKPLTIKFLKYENSKKINKKITARNLIYIQNHVNNKSIEK